MTVYLAPNLYGFVVKPQSKNKDRIKIKTEFSMKKILYYHNYLQLTDNGELAVKQNNLPIFEEDFIVLQEDMRDLYYSFPAAGVFLINMPAVIPRDCIVIRFLDIKKRTFFHGFKWVGSKLEIDECLLGIVEIRCYGECEYEFTRTAV